MDARKKEAMLAIKIVTDRDMIRSVAEDFKEQYQLEGGHWSAMFFTPGDVVYNRLMALDLETCTAEDVHRVMGAGWLVVNCQSCGNDATELHVRFEHPDIEDKACWLCPDCIGAAFNMVRAVKDKL